MPRAWGKEWEPGSRNRRGGCPVVAESTREEALSEEVEGKGHGHHCSQGGMGRRGEDAFFLACSGEQKVYPREQVGGSLWSLGPLESPARGLC